MSSSLVPASRSQSSPDGSMGTPRVDRVAACPG